MNALIVFNFKSFLPAQAQASMKAAAERWNVQYVEVTEPLAPIHHFWQKTWVPFTVGQAFDRVAVLDADMLVRSDCPNVFDLVPENAFGVVSRVQSHRPARQQRELGRRVLRLKAMRFGLRPYRVEAQHLNGGLIVYSPARHMAALQDWKRAGQFVNWRRFWWNDQAALSCILARGTTNVHWLPWQFNTLDAGRNPRFSSGPMTTWVYHFNAPRRRSLAEVMADVSWEVGPNALLAQ